MAGPCHTPARYSIHPWRDDAVVLHKHGACDGARLGATMGRLCGFLMASPTTSETLSYEGSMGRILPRRLLHRGSLPAGGGRRLDREGGHSLDPRWRQIR